MRPCPGALLRVSISLAAMLLLLVSPIRAEAVEGDGAESAATPAPVVRPAPTSGGVATEIPPASVSTPQDELAPAPTPRPVEPPEDVDVADDEQDQAEVTGAAVQPVAETGNEEDIGDILAQVEDSDTEISTISLIDGFLGEAPLRSSANLAHYELGADAGFLGEPFVVLGRLLFSAGASLFAFADWALRFVLRFDLGNLLAEDTATLSSRYGQLIRGGDGGIPLHNFMLLIAIAHAGWQMFRNRAQAAAAEVMVAVVIAVGGAALLGNAEDTACTGLSIMNDLTVGMMALGSTDIDARTVERAGYCDGGVPEQSQFDTVLESAFDSFVHEPFLLLQWGSVPEATTPCGRLAVALVEKRAWDNADEPREWMRDAGCEQMSLFNARMSANRVMAAGAYTMTTGAFAVAIILTAGTLLVAQVAGALLVLSMPFAVVVGISPGTGRELLARWFHSLLKVTVLFMGSGFFLSLMLSTVSSVLDGTAGGPIVVRMLTAVVVAWSLVFLRGRIFSSMRFASKSAAQRLAGPGADVGPQGRGPGAVLANTAVRAAATAADLHAGLAAVKAGVSIYHRGGSSDAGTSTAVPTAPTALNRASRLRRHQQHVDSDSGSAAS